MVKAKLWKKLDAGKGGAKFEVKFEVKVEVEDEVMLLGL